MKHRKTVEQQIESTMKALNSLGESSITAIAREAGISRHLAEVHLREAAKTGTVIIEDRPHPASRVNTTYYAVPNREERKPELRSYQLKFRANPGLII